VSAGYSFTTIVSGVDEPARIEVSFRLDDAALIRVFGLDDNQPQLCIRHGQTAVDFLPTTGRITEADARVARELADRAAVYATDVEWLKAEQNAKAAADTAT
jgi:hypothetical protein